MAAPRLLSSPPTKTMVIFLLFWRKFANLYLSNLLSHEMLLDNLGGDIQGIFHEKKTSQNSFLSILSEIQGQKLETIRQKFSILAIRIQRQSFEY